jgi:hypothetical protein
MITFKLKKMKIFKSIILFLAVAFTFMSAGAQNVSLNVLTQNAGQVNLGGTVFVEITLANTSSSVSVPVTKVRPQISVPVSIVSIPATGHVLPLAGQLYLMQAVYSGYVMDQMPYLQILHVLF